ncbi:alkaline phosphatase D family protein [Nocardioides taihuensis]|uniref:Alkaline phosphatase D family protein n=1 Tax=Nocardioides taihuensis TaxID=1835606 RepID=A0ABW0BFZ1_9ACTN
MGGLVLGPLLRHVDETSGCIWVETADTATVTLRARRDAGGEPIEPGDREEHVVQVRTFAVHGHHYALVCVEGLVPGSKYPYTVEVDGEQVWPPADSPYPPSLIATLDPDKPLRLAYGSCRTSVTHDEAGNKAHGVDALHAYALRMAGVTDPAHDDDPDPGSDARWPDLVLFLGDQVYADETTDEMRAFIESRRDIEQPPWAELKDYEEYAHLYKLAWSDPANRWLLSTVPTAMIFDDHDIRDDWNTSLTWKQSMETTSWWHGRVVAGLASYWVHQHLGNMTPAQRAQDEIWREIAAYDGPDEFDASDLLDRFADRADQHPESYRWSFARDFGDQARLVVIDSRAARVLEPQHRSMLDPDEMRWLDEQLTGDVDHLLIGSSLPFLLAPGLHHMEAWSEALADGGWGRRGSKLGEKIRQAGDLEHWAAFQDGFQKVAAMVLEVASGRRGTAPGTVTFLGGDVHHSYVSEAFPSDGSRTTSRIIQAVCSPIRNPMPRRLRFLVAVMAYGVAGPVGHVVARSAKVPDSPLKWNLLKGPWFDNNLATLEVHGRGLRLWWATGKVDGKEHERPRLHRVADLTV